MDTALMVCCVWQPLPSVTTTVNGPLAALTVTALELPMAPEEPVQAYESKPHSLVTVAVSVVVLAVHDGVMLTAMAGGSTSETLLEAAVQPKASFTVTEYDPGARSVTVAVVCDVPIHAYVVDAEQPPLGLTVSEPLAALAHEMSREQPYGFLMAFTESGEGSLTTTGLDVSAHTPLSYVAVTV